MKTFIFDLDDTIIGYDAVSERAWISACQIRDGKYGPYSSEQVYDAIHSVSKWFWSDPVRFQNGRLNLIETRRNIVLKAFTENLHLTEKQDLETAISIADEFSRKRVELIEPIPGAIKTLDNLRKKGKQLAMITNGTEHDQQEKINRFNLAQYFDVILIEGSFGTGKPHPKIFLEALKKLSAKPATTCMIGDSLEYDIAGAKPLGITTIWNNWAHRALPANLHSPPDIEINRISEIMNLDFQRSHPAKFD